MRTTPSIAHLFQPLETAIRTELLPSIATHFSPLQRDMFALPARHGGLAIHDPTKIADEEYTNSRLATEPLIQTISEQKTNIDCVREFAIAEQLSSNKTEVLSRKRKWQTSQRDAVASQLSPAQHRQFEELSHRGTSTWLTSLPLQEHGFTLNKLEFRDAIAIRYDLPVEGLPRTCACGKVNSLEHCLSCARGGYVYLRHNQLRDLTANLLEEAGCRDVTVEPRLLPLSTETFHLRSAITGDDARLDVAARGIWSPMERTLLDFRVFNSLAPSNATLSVTQALEKHEQEKKRCYGERVIQIEKCSFTPVVLSTAGVMGNEADKLYKQIARRLATRTNQSYNDCIRYIRQRVSFSLVKTLVVSRRGFRGTRCERFQKDTDLNLLYSNQNLIY